jgi:hypothetical protein
MKSKKPAVRVRVGRTLTEKSGRWSRVLTPAEIKSLRKPGKFKF